jgi:hypothetical protein
MYESTGVALEKANRISGAQMARHERLVHWVVRRQWLGVLSFQDALHEGRIGLWSALCHYDPDRGTAFSSYAVPAIAHAVWRAVAMEARSLESGPFHVPLLTDSNEIEALDWAQVIVLRACKRTTSLFMSFLSTVLWRLGVQSMRQCLVGFAKVGMELHA